MRIVHRDCVVCLQDAFSEADFTKENVPPSVLKLTELWTAAKGDPSLGDELCELLATQIAANYIPETVTGALDLIETNEPMQEFYPEEIEVSGFNFDGQRFLPSSVTVYAVFRLPFKRDISQQEMDAWSERFGEGLGWGANFEWSFKDLTDDDWDGWLVNADGAEMWIKQDA